MHINTHTQDFMTKCKETDPNSIGTGLPIVVGSSHEECHTSSELDERYVCMLLFIVNIHAHVCRCVFCVCVCVHATVCDSDNQGLGRGGRGSNKPAYTSNVSEHYGELCI